MNDGRRVLTRSQPLNAPMPNANRNVRTTAMNAGRWNWTMSRPTARLAAPIIEPTDRSNSPAIISSDTATPMIPT
jgi:hypothetical protein